MSYCLNDIHPLEAQSGRGPVFPEDVGFIELASPGRSRDWALYSYTLDGPVGWEPDYPVSGQLAALLHRAEGFPPALAVARVRMNQLFDEKRPSRAEFLGAYEAALSSALGRPWRQRPLLTRVLREELGYLNSGDSVWLMGSSRADPDRVLWISDDYHFYSNPRSDFDLPPARLARLPVVPKTEQLWAWLGLS